MARPCSRRRSGRPSSAALTVTQMSYDALNRVICTALRENAGAFGSLPGACTQSTGPIADQISQIAYDLAGQKHTETRGVGSSIQALYGTWTYGLDGELATVLDGNSNLTTNLYDGFNRLAKVEYPMPTLGSGVSNPGDAEAFTLYDANSNLKSKTKRDGATIINFTYDVLNRRISKTFPATTSANVSYAYDAAGRPLNALFANVGGTPGVAWTYDAAGRRITEATNGVGISAIENGGHLTAGQVAGAFVSGAIVGEGAVNIPETGGLSAVAAGVALGATAGASGNLTQRGIDTATGAQSGFSARSLAVDTAVGAVGGAAGGAVGKVKVGGLSAGRNSALAVGRAARTRIATGAAVAMSAKTAIKSAIGHQTADAARTAVGVATDTAKRSVCNRSRGACN